MHSGHHHYLPTQRELGRWGGREKGFKEPRGRGREREKREREGERERERRKERERETEKVNKNN